MKKNLFYFLSVNLTAILLIGVAFAQNDRRTVSEASKLYVVSAKAGGVNFVEGDVTVARRFGKGGRLLSGDTLEVGDKVSTGAGGKAEILLNPGSFVRLGENSDFEFATTSLEDLQLKLTRGSAMFEVITDNQFSFVVNAPKAEFNIVQTGVYRIDVLNGETSRIEVWKGKAQINGAAEVIKGGKQATVSNGQVSIAKFDRGDKDALEAFSKSRAKDLSKANALLQNRAVRTSLMNSFYRTRWSLYDSYGLWVYSPSYSGFCFLPFGYGWNSPYGYYYHNDIWGYNLPPIIYTSPSVTQNPTNPTNPTQPQLSGPGRIRNTVKSPQADGNAAEDTRITPPFARVQRQIGTVRDETVYAPSTPVNVPVTVAPSSPPPSIVSPSSIPTTRTKGDQ